MRRQFTPQQKAAVAFAALRGNKTINQIAAENEAHPTQVKQWRDAVKATMTDAFADKRKTTTKAADSQKHIDELHRVIGLRDAELEWLKKRSIVNWGSSPLAAHSTLPAAAAPHFCPSDLTILIETDHAVLSVARQAELLGLSRRSYYQPVENAAVQILLKRDMDAIDTIYTDHPFYGYRRMRLELLDRYGVDLGRKRIRTVMQLLGLEAIHPKPDTSKSGVGATARSTRH